MRVLVYSSFEGSIQDWGGTVSLSSESLMAGGESLEVDSIAIKSISSRVKQGRTYSVSFLAKSVLGNNTLNVRMTGANGATDFSGSADINDVNWQQFELNMVELDHSPALDEILEIDGGASQFYIDDFRLVEIIDRYYIINNSWQTPDECFEDILGNYRGTSFNLGCKEYMDQESNIHYLHSFSRLCNEDVVGCELMIDTHNYSDYQSAIWNDDGDLLNPGDAGNGICDLSEPDCITVDQDEYIFAVYNSKKQCLSEDKGCQRLGEPYKYSGQVIYGDNYLKNDYDQYSTILCSEDAADCREWSTSDGLSYFKDPGDQVCEWIEFIENDIAVWDWIKAPIKRCDTNSNALIDVSGDSYYNYNPIESQICVTNEDCGSGVDCIIDTNYYRCDQGEGKTFGYGGQGNSISQPTDIDGEYWIGLCPADQSGCSEYIDPISIFRNNLIKNSDFSQDIDGDGDPDIWENFATYSLQSVTLEEGTLYRLARREDSGGDINTDAITLDCGAAPNSLSELLVSNQLTPVLNDRFVLSPVENSALLLTSEKVSCSVRVNNLDGIVELKPVVIDYRYANEVDRTSCNGIVSYDNGCLLFNERTQEGRDMSGLIYDADLTIDDENGVFPISNPDDLAQNNANTLLKVTPNRSCDKWLSCRSYVKDENNNNVCFDIGLCNALDDNLECKNFLVSDLELTQNDHERYVGGGIDAEEFSNKSGYARVGYAGNSLDADYFKLNEMPQIGQVTNVSNGDFELFGNNGYPLGWIPAGNAVWSSNLFSVIDNPISAQVEGVGYPMIGRSFLKFGSGNSRNSPLSEFIDVEPNTDYVISAYINTINLGFQNDVGPAAFYLDVNPFNANEEPEAGGITNYQTGDSNEAVIFDVYNGQDWRLYQGRFRTGGEVFRLKLQLVGYIPSVGDCWPGDAALDNCVGNIYIDDIKIRPVLNHRDEDYLPQSCRLYPDDDSLSCDYFEDSGIRRKGWLGYCLEYDRYPGQEDACLMWYPVDKVMGEGIEEGAGYAGHMPIYYTTDHDYISDTGRYEEEINLEGIYNHLYIPISTFQFNPGQDDLIKELLSLGGVGLEFVLTAAGDGTDGTLRLEASNNFEDGCFGIDCDCLDNDTPTTYIPRCTDLLDITFQDVWDHWFVYGEDMCVGNRCYSSSDYNGLRAIGVQAVFSTDQNSPSLRGFDIYLGNIDNLSNDDSTRVETIELEVNIPFATEIIQTVTPIGQNKFWSGRVFEGSSTIMPCTGYSAIFSPMSTLDCIYPTSFSPFGAILPAEPVSNPYEWDGLGMTDIQPLFYISNEENDLAHMGKIHNTQSIRNLFARSYGHWVWDDTVSRYVASNTGGWGPPEGICDPTTGRPAYPGALCSIPPAVRNIKLNDENTVDTVINNSGFVNLTFNSFVDSQQLPLVSYSIDWGDGDETTVSGVEMRGRPNLDNPHSVYHLYSYWDLLAKHNINIPQIGGQNLIFCADGGSQDAFSYGGSLSVSVGNPPTSDWCLVIPRVKIQDNWGWCNQGVTYDSNSSTHFSRDSIYTIGDCNQWVLVGDDDLDGTGLHYVIVSER